MSSFTPTQITLEPLDRPDQLGGAVMQSLSRPIGSRKVWGPIFSLFAGALTVGLAPLIAWPRRFAQFAVSEEQQLWHLAEWLRLNTGDPDAAALPDLTRQAEPPFTLYLIPWLMAAVVISQLVPMLGSTGIHHLGEIRAVIANFYRQSANLNFFHTRINPAYPPERRQIIVTLCLFIGFGSHWLHVRSHAAAVAKVATKMNPILVRQGLQPIGISGTAMMNPLWTLAAVVGVFWGAWWAIPAAIAGELHYRYSVYNSMQIRGELAQRVRSLLLRQRPALDVPTPFRFRATCMNQLCRQLLPKGATFCPRCGSRLPETVNAVA